MAAKQLSKSADFFIKAVVIFTTIVAMLFFAKVYNAFVFLALALLTLIALILKGTADFILFVQSNKRRR